MRIESLLHPILGVPGFPIRQSLLRANTRVKARTTLPRLVDHSVRIRVTIRRCLCRRYYSRSMRPNPSSHPPHIPPEADRLLSRVLLDAVPDVEWPNAQECEAHCVACANILLSEQFLSGAIVAGRMITVGRRRTKPVSRVKRQRQVSDVSWTL